MPTYRVEAGTSVTVKARSSIHDTVTRWDKVSGTVEADPGALDGGGTRATFTVDMGAFDAGDWLKNRKLKKDLAADKYPTAVFELREVKDVTQNGDAFEATATGVIRYRDHEVAVEIKGTGTMSAGSIEAKGAFDINIRGFGMEPPKVLMFKMEPEVTIDVTLRARAS